MMFGIAFAAILVVVHSAPQSGQTRRGSHAAIPRIFHQQWSHPDGKPMPVDMVVWRKSWLRCLGDGWEHKLWNAETNRMLVAEYAPHFLPIYDGYDAEIKRLDSVRYLYMHVYGGIYADLDMECIGDPHKILNERSAVLAYNHNMCMMGPYFLASVPNHTFWMDVMRTMATPPGRRNLVVQAATGVSLLTEAFELYTGLVGQPYHVHDNETFDAAVALPNEGVTRVHVISEEHICMDVMSVLAGTCASDSPNSFAVHRWVVAWGDMQAKKPWELSPQDQKQILRVRCEREMFFPAQGMRGIGESAKAKEMYLARWMPRSERCARMGCPSGLHLAAPPKTCWKMDASEIKRMVFEGKKTQQAFCDEPDTDSSVDARALSAHMQVEPLAARTRDTVFDLHMVARLMVGKYRNTWRGQILMKDAVALSQYQNLMTKLRPQTIFDLGTARGGSALWFASQLKGLGLHEATVVTIDIEDMRTAESNQEMETLGNVRFVHGDLNDCNRMFRRAQALGISTPRPWLIAEDCHVDAGVVMACFASRMASGDYILFEDTHPFHPEHSFSDANDMANYVFTKKKYRSDTMTKLDVVEEVMLGFGDQFSIDTHIQDLFGYNGATFVNSVFVKN